MNESEKLDLIEKTIIKGAEQAREDAAYSGSWSDGGAAQMEKQFRAFKDGYFFAKTGATKLYGHIIKQAELESDAEYQEYMRLKQKFGEDE